MLKFLLLAAVVLWLLYSPGVRRLLRGLGSDDAPVNASPDRGSAPTPARPLEMVPCAHCGVHLPANDALVNDAGRPFCSEAHRRAGARRT